MLLLIAAFCAGAFAGAAIYISLVQHPAALEAGVAGRFFAPMYRRAAPLQASLAMVGSIAGLLAWLLGEGLLAFLGAVLLLSVVPITLVVIKPVNDRLLAPGLDPEAPQVMPLLRQWGTLHAMRSALSALAFLCFLLSLS